MGFAEIAVIGVVVLVLFGAKKLPELGRGVGQGLKEFKDATKEEPSADAVKVEDIRVEERQS